MTIRTFENKKPQIHDSAFVDPSALVIGDVYLEKDCSIWPMSVLRGDINKITIGERSNIQDGTIIHVNHAGKFNPDGDPVNIGKEVIVGHQAMLHGCVIEDNVLIGIGAKILDRARIKSEVIIGAGSLVPPNKILESGYLYFGSPVKKIRKLSNDEKQYLHYSANYYVELKDKHSFSN